ncbi:30S ribosomal protein S6 [Candidatus Saccharibacteria bacterium CPR2]|nr:30S ribosomal protein S6 [Candidatus Saccharibacteria bacterium CPR2]
MKDYELVVLIHPDLEIDLEKPLNKIKKIITDNKGKIIKEDNWGKRKLAYPIKKEEFAIYVYYDIQLPGDAVEKVSSTFNITDEVLRYLITLPVPKQHEEDSEKDKKSEPEVGTKKAADAKIKKVKGE